MNEFYILVVSQLTHDATNKQPIAKAVTDYETSRKVVMYSYTVYTHLSNFLGCISLVSPS